MAERKSYIRKSKEKEMTDNTEIKVEENVDIPVEKKEVEKPSVLSSVGKKPFSMDDKIQTIINSRMPEKQKEEYIQSLLPVVEEKGIPFHIYVKVKGIVPTVAAGMRAYPKASGIKLATIERWDKIFEGF